MDKKKSFVNKLKSSFIVIILIPVLFLGGVIFYSSYHYIRQQKEADLKNLAEQNLADIENRMSQCEYSAIYTASNYSLQSFIQMDETRYKDLNEKSRSIAPLLHNIILSNRYFKELKIYTARKYTVLSDMLVYLEDVRNEEWYQKAMHAEADEIVWGIENDHYYLTRQIQTAYPVKDIGLVKLSLKKAALEDSFTIFDDIPIHIEIKNKDEVLGSFTNRKGVKSYLPVLTAGLGNTGWDIAYTIDANYYKSGLGGLIIPMILLVSVLFLTWIGISVFSKKLVKDLFRLVEEVQFVENGNLNVEIQESEIDEINILAISIRNMLGRIKKLIQEVYTAERERQGLELNLLKSKMNPHFLYNNLSAINWIALDCEQPRISEITTEMANFYRTALNKDKDMDKLSVEVSNIKSYVRLQLIAHEESFNVAYEIPESQLDELVPCFILQPLVENSIEHGIERLRGENGFIRIAAYKEQNTILLEVFDNGKELYQKIGSREMEPEEYGYGTMNVHRRIQLLCGNDSGLTIYADEDGTHAVIRLREGMR